MISYAHMFQAVRIMLLSLFLFLATLAPSYAADCTIIYGGGKIECQSDATPLPTATPIPAAPSNPTQSKGGLPINPPSNATTSPATGPEILGLISLLPAAGIGVWLRRKRI